MKAAITLILVGGAIILAVIVGSGIRHESDRARVANFYQSKGNNTTLPRHLEPLLFGPIEVMSFAAGCVMILAGTYRTRTSAPSRSAEPNTPADGIGK